MEGGPTAEGLARVPPSMVFVPESVPVDVMNEIFTGEQLTGTSASLRNQITGWVGSSLHSSIDAWAPGVKFSPATLMEVPWPTPVHVGVGE